MAKLMISFVISFFIFGCGTFNANSDSTNVASNQIFMSVKEKCKIDSEYCIFLPPANRCS